MLNAVEKSFSGTKQFLDATRKAFSGVELPRHIVKVALQGFIPPPHDGDVDDPAKKTVVMVPGWGCGVGTMKTLGRALNGNVNVLYPDNLPGGLLAAFSQMSLDQEATNIADFVDRADRGGEEDIYFAGHSNGGVASLLAFVKMQERSSDTLRNRLKGVITMASPINGSPDYHYGHAPLISRLPATKHLRPNSSVHRELSTHYEAISLCIASSRDELLDLDMQWVKGRPTVNLDFSHWDYTFGPPEKIQQVAGCIQATMQG